MLLVNVNGTTVLQPRRQSPELDALVRKIRHQGQLVSCLVGSGADLAAMAGGTDIHKFAAYGTTHDQILVRLPPAARSDEAASE